MANINLKQNPNLTSQNVYEILTKKLNGKYEVGYSQLIGADLY